MELIPMINLTKRQIWTGPSRKTIIPSELINTIKSDLPLYFHDQDGITSDKPNLCLIQQLGQKIQIWADTGPRELGDIVDNVMAGATRITIRTPLWPYYSLSATREITEQNVYHHMLSPTNVPQSQSPDGYVLTEPIPSPQKDFILQRHIKNLTSRYDLYLSDSNWKNHEYWKKIGITGILIFLEDYPEYLKHVH